MTTLRRDHPLLRKIWSQKALSCSHPRRGASERDFCECRGRQQYCDAGRKSEGVGTQRNVPFTKAPSSVFAREAMMLRFDCVLATLFPPQSCESGFNHSRVRIKDNGEQ
jgi:hypothetical protein